jgi:hypothetical protein
MAGAQIGPRSRHCSKGRGFNPPSQKKTLKGWKEMAQKKKEKKKKRQSFPL